MYLPKGYVFFFSFGHYVLKTGIDCACFGLEWGMILEGTTEVLRECINVFVVSIPNE